MYELVQTGQQSYYINCPAKIGIYRASDTEVYLIDSGNDKDAGKKVRRILDGQGWNLKGIINTHSHADHIGGNRYLQQQMGCRIFANGLERTFTEHPVLEPTFLFGGYPCSDLRHKFTMAQPSEASDFSDEEFPGELEVISLPGHCFDMVGIRTPDDTVFLADCVSSRATLEKYQITFLCDVEEALKTLDKVEALQAAMFVPSHAEPTEDIRELVCLNRDKIHEIADRLVQVLREPVCFEELLKKVFDAYDLTMNFEQYALVGSTVRSYLAWLKDAGRITAEAAENRLMWKKL